MTVWGKGEGEWGDSLGGGGGWGDSLRGRGECT